MALIVAVVLFALIGVSALLALARGSDTDAERQRTTEAALAQAKAALIGYAAGVPLTGPERLGDLPCPDVNNDGDADPPCAGEATRLGRLPWRTLGLPDLRDGDGERLWYAVSVGFKNNPRTACVNPADGGCLNSDSTGSITVRDRANLVVHDGRARVVATATEFNYNAAIALVIAPGAGLTRQDGAAQDRSPAGATNPVNYLDTAFSEDNANFIDHDLDNGFISGPVRSVTGDVVLNDRIAVLTYQDLMPVLEKRVVREAGRCLDQYAARPANNLRYPWAADTSESALNNRYADPSGNRTGRLPDGIIGSANPDQLFKNSRDDSGAAMEDTWPGLPCALGLGYDWWTNWKLYVFYALADAFKPGSTAITPTCAGNCLTVLTPSANMLNRNYFLVVGGKRLPSVGGGQPRAMPGERANPRNYLEGENDFSTPTADVHETRLTTASFNDAAIFRP
ncbi:MAG: hypothetical protein IT531_15830 [Burkholderiales bacterium]|nr:hypothetical protein [Burkholderiales bacterium]